MIKTRFKEELAMHNSSIEQLQKLIAVRSTRTTESFTDMFAANDTPHNLVEKPLHRGRKV